MIGVLASGSGTNLQALLDAGLPVSAVASNKCDAFALERAQRASVNTRVFLLEDFSDRADRDRAMASWLSGYKVRLVVCAGYMHLLSPSFLEKFPSCVINVHPSLLPDFPGMNAITDALESGVEKTGVTVHYVDEGVDTGPVIEQVEVSIHEGDTLVTLQARIQEVEHHLLPEVTCRLVEKIRFATL